jgi:hypothetical protein
MPEPPAMPGPTSPPAMPSVPRHIPARMPAPMPPAPTPPATVYSCPMHPEVTSPMPGKCPRCGMDLEPTPKRGTP